MNTRDWLVAAGASALLGAAATAHATTAPHHRTTHHKRSQLFVAPFGPVPIITPRYIYYPGATPDPNAMPSPGCDVNGSGCTAIELCELWGEC